MVEAHALWSCKGLNADTGVVVVVSAFIYYCSMRSSCVLHTHTRTVTKILLLLYTCVIRMYSMVIAYLDI
jgi:hypothetical protein